MKKSRNFIETFLKICKCFIDFLEFFWKISLRPGSVTPGNAAVDDTRYNPSMTGLASAPKNSLPLMIIKGSLSYI